MRLPPNSMASRRGECSPRSTPNASCASRTIHPTTKCRSFGITATTAAATATATRMITTRRSGVARRVAEIDVERHRAEQQERHEQDRLDDEAADAVERAGGDGRSGRNTLALEEPDVDRDARRGGRDRQIDVGDRELQGVDGPERQRDRRGTERRHRLGDPRQLRHDQAEQHEPPVGVLQRFDELVEVETGERRHEHEHRQQRQRDADDRTDAEPAELHQSSAPRG